MSARGEITAGREVRSRLGRTGVDEVLASVWAIDCLSCGDPLNGKAALSVDDLGYSVTAGLFHEHCRASEWNESGLIVRRSSGALLSHHTVCVAVPGRTAEGVESPKPVLVINPGLEMVTIERRGSAAAERWRVIVSHQFADAGLGAPAASGALPVTKGTATLKRRELSVAFPGAVDTYGVKLTGQGRELVRSDGGIMVAVTHALDPSGFTVAERKIMLRGDRTVMGWVPLTT